MTADAEMVGASAPAPSTGRLAAGTALADGRYVVGQIQRAAGVAEIYAGVDQQTGHPVSIHLLDARLAARPEVRARVLAAAAAVMGVESKNLCRVLHGGEHGGEVYVVSELVEGNSLGELLARKQQTGATGFGARGTLNILGGVCNALAALHAHGAHGGLGPGSVFVNAAGRVKVSQLGIAAAVPAAAAAGLGSAPSLAPEAARSGEASPAADLFAAGHLLYQLLVGQPLQKGGRRPSEVAGVAPVVDSLVARLCSPAPENRPTDAAALKQLLAEALSAPAAAARPAQAAAPARPSLAQSIATPAAVPTSSPSIQLDTAALADTHEKWLISKGRLDYGPFSLAQIVEQIEADQIVPGNVIVDNDTGARGAVEDHPLLAPLVDAARQRRDDRRRAQAEVAHAKQEKSRGFALYGFIGAGVLALAVGAYFIVVKSSAAEEASAGEGVSAVGEAELNAKIAFPKTPKPQKRSRRAGRGGGGGGGSDDDTLALDMSSGLGTEVLDNGTINNVVQRHGGALGGCLGRAGARYAQINFVIEGPTGRVNWVRVNGEKSGALYSCVNKVMRRMKFPTVDGPRTRAEFDMSL